MAANNNIQLIGNLGDDVTLHHFEGGGCIGRFSIATSHSYTSKQTGEKITNTYWHRIVVRNKQAEICEKFLSKGSSVSVQGVLTYDEYEKDGNKIRYAQIEAKDVLFLGGKKQDTEPQQDTDNDDLPF